MNIYALQTARAGSKSVLNKNIKTVQGKPLYLHNILYASNCEVIKKVYCSTDCPTIKEGSMQHDFEIIDRPERLRGDNASHRETLEHGLLEIEKRNNETVDVLVVLLGNSLSAFTEDLNKAITLLNDDTDGIMSVSEFNMFNCFRAYKKSGEYLETFVSPEFIKENAVKKNFNDKNSSGDTYFFNGSFWVCKREYIIDKRGLEPFNWLGDRIKPFIQDVHMEIDAKWQLRFYE